MFNKKGFTLIEILLALTISIVLILSSFIIYKKVSIQLNIKKDFEDIMYAQSSVRTVYKGFTSYYIANTSIMELLKTMGYFKDNEIHKDSNGESYTRNHYGDLFQISPSSYNRNENGGDYGSSFEIIDNGIPNAECIGLAKKIKKDSFFLMQINNIIIFKEKGYDPAIDYSEEKIISSCSKGKNEIYLVSY